MSTETSNVELIPEYDLTKYKVRRVGEGRRLMGQIKLDVDVARVFPDSESVNQALRTLIRLSEKGEIVVRTK